MEGSPCVLAESTRVYSAKPVRHTEPVIPRQLRQPPGQLPVTPPGYTPHPGVKLHVKLEVKPEVKLELELVEACFEPSAGGCR